MASTQRKVIKLQHPIESGSEVVDELAFRRGKMGDLKGINVGDDMTADEIITIAARLSGQPTHIIESLDEDDVSEVFAIALGFIARCLGGGGVPLPSSPQS